MPKRRGKKDGGSKRGGACNGLPPSSDDEDHRTPDNASVASSQSDMQSIIGDGHELEGDDVDELSALENFEEKLKDVIDGLTQKSAKGRIDCLKSLMAAFSKKYIFDFIYERKMTVQDCLERCLKKGRGDEQVYAAGCLSLLFLQLGASSDSEEAFKAVRGLLQTLMLDKSVSCKARAACAQSFGVCTFIAGGEIEDLCEAMKSFERVFSASYFKGDGSAPTHSPDVTAMHGAALNSWGLLLSICPPNVVNAFIDSHLSKIKQLLSSSDVELRITTGETIALMYELARDEDEDFVGDDFDELCLNLKQLATDSNKYRAKKDRKQQRSSFREILHAVEEGDYPRMRVRFGSESLNLNSWTVKKHYDTMLAVVASGMQVHLTENDLLRDIFGLGAPIPADAKPSYKPSRQERHLFNAAAFKARTKVRSKNRDKRSAVVSHD